MSNYKKMYFVLFHAITDALLELQNGDIPYAEYLLKKAQVNAETMYSDKEVVIGIFSRKEQDLP